MCHSEPQAVSTSLAEQKRSVPATQEELPNGGVERGYGVGHMIPRDSYLDPILHLVILALQEASVGGCPSGWDLSLNSDSMVSRLSESRCGAKKGSFWWEFFLNICFCMGPIR